MKKMYNNEKIIGRIYQHNLVKKTVQSQTSANFGKEFISGNIEVAVDEAGLVIIPVHFTYVTETTSSGNKNITYSNLEKIINENNTWIEKGKDEAAKVKIDTALSVNDFYTQDDKLITSKVNEGGFVSFVNGELCPENERNIFTTDMLITQATRVEADPEKNIEKDYLVLKGAVFNFRNELLPVDFVVKNEDGIRYFEDLNISKNEPVLTKVWGKIDCHTISNEIKEDTAFGEESIRVFERKVKEWIVTGGAAVPYEIGDESIITKAEIEKAVQDRNLKIADIKKCREDYLAQKTSPVAATANTTPTVVNVVTDTFNF